MTGLFDALSLDPDLGGPMPLVRTAFGDDAAWRRVVDAVLAPTDFGDGSREDYEPNITAVSDPSFEGATGAALLARAGDASHGYFLLADARSMQEAAMGGEITIVFLDLAATPEDEEEFGWVRGREFRCVTEEVAGIEANLAIANMDFEEFADHVAADGVFRGFPE